LISILEKHFIYLWRTIDGPDLIMEHAFTTSRKWRFDFADVPLRIAIEIEGGADKSRHRQLAGFTADCHKYNTALYLGWRVFRLAGSMITEQNLVPLRDYMLAEQKQ